MNYTHCYKSAIVCRLTVFSNLVTYSIMSTATCVIYKITVKVCVSFQASVSATVNSGRLVHVHIKRMPVSRT